MSILENNTKEEIVDMLNISEYHNDEMLELLYETACRLKIEIVHPFGEHISYTDFIKEYTIKMINRTNHYRELIKDN